MTLGVSHPYASSEGEGHQVFQGLGTPLSALVVTPNGVGAMGDLRVEKRPL